MSTIKQAVERQFSATADAYKISHVHARGADLARLVDLAALGPGLRVLDAGCGAGHAAAAVAPHAASVVAVDLSPAMLDVTAALAHERGLANVETRRGDVEALPCDDGEFDRVVSRYSAHHWPHADLALAEIRRVLKPGGRFVLSDIVAPPGDSADSYLQTIEILRDPSHVRDRSIDQWVALLERTGFGCVAVEHFDCWLDFADWTARMATPEAAVAVLRRLMAGAPVEVKEALRIEPNCDFTLPCALFVAEVEP